MPSDVRVEVFCKDCVKCHEKDMFGVATILECRRTSLPVEPEGYCKWGERRSDA